MGGERETKTCPNCQILPTPPRAGAAVSPGPLGSCCLPTASWSLPAPPFSHCCNIFLFPCTSPSLFLQVPLFLCRSTPLFSFSVCASVLFLVPLFFTLCPAACHYFCLSLFICLPIPNFNSSLSALSSSLPPHPPTPRFSLSGAVPLF